MPNAPKQTIPPLQAPSDSGEEEEEDEEGRDEEESENASYSPSASDLTVEFNSRMKATSKCPLQAQNHDEKDLASKKRAKVNADGPMKGERSFVREDMSLISEAKAKELVVEWKKLRKAEAELLLKKLDLMKEHISLVLEAMEEM